MSRSTPPPQRTMCPMNCYPTLCGMEVMVANDDVVELRGDRANPDSRGFLCIRGQATREIQGNPQRLLYPMARAHRGRGDWHRISWVQALERMVGNARRAGREALAIWPSHGALANDFGVFAHLSLALRFANMYGCQWWDTSMICWGLGGFGLGLTGAMEVNTANNMSQYSDLIIQWGANHASQPTTAQHIAAARKRGARTVAIDVRLSEACRTAHDHFIVRPGTDAALALAMMHVIIAEGLQDDGFIGTHTIGFEALRDHVRGMTPEWAANICGVPGERIARLARQYARTERAMLLLGGGSMYKDRHGWQASRAISCLPPLTGKLGKDGAGFGPRHGASPHGRGFADILAFAARPDGAYIPAQMPAILDAFAEGRIANLWLFGSDFTTSFADATRVKSALDNVETIVAHDLFMNDTIREHADIVLPGTTWLEDLGAKATARHVYLMEPLLSPAGETRSMSDIIRELARRLDVDDFYPWPGRHGHIDAVLDHPSTGHATVESLRASGGMVPLEVSDIAHPDHHYATPSGKIEFYSARAADVDLPALPSYHPRPVDEFPLELRTGRTLSHFHAFYDSGRALPTLARRDSGPLLWLSSADASERAIGDGASIRIYNHRGSFHATALVTDKVPAGTVWIHTGWPGLNALTSGARALSDEAAQLFPFSTGQSGFDARVEVTIRRELTDAPVQ